MSSERLPLIILPPVVRVYLGLVLAIVTSAVLFVATLFAFKCNEVLSAEMAGPSLIILGTLIAWSGSRDGNDRVLRGSFGLSLMAIGVLWLVVGTVFGATDCSHWYCREDYACR